MARVLFIEPFYGGSHRAFADGLREHSRHDLELLTLPEGEWRSRMRRGAIALAGASRSLDGDYDAIVATDMLDVGQFLALTRPRFAKTPVLYYLHENQFTYPRLKGTKLNSWFGQVNYMSALAADVVAFNSEFHRRDFLGALERLTREPTNWLEPETLPGLDAKATVLPIGLDLRRFDDMRVPRSERPLLLWNHRWEFDKAPGMFAKAVMAVAGELDGFDVAIAGDPGPNPHPAMEELREALGERIVHFGRAESADDYARLLWRSHVAVSTSRQEFFGIAMVEAMYAGCFPIAPNTLNFPNIVPVEHHDACLFADETDLVAKLRAALSTAPDTEDIRAAAGRWDWNVVAPEWDIALDGLIDSCLLQQ